MGKGAGNCEARPAIAIAENLDLSMSIDLDKLQTIPKTNPTHKEQYLVFENSLLEEDAILINWNSSKKIWTLWAKMKRGGVETEFVKALGVQEAFLKKYSNKTKTSFMNGNIPDWSALNIKTQNLAVRYTPHGSFGKVPKKLWFWKATVENFPEYKIPTYTKDELRIANKKVLRLRDLDKKSREKYKKTNVPSEEDILQHKDWEKNKSGFFVQTRHLKEQSRFEQLAQKVLDSGGFVTKWQAGKEDSRERFKNQVLAHFPKQISRTLQTSISDWVEIMRIEKFSKIVVQDAPNKNLFSHRGQIEIQTQDVKKALNYMEEKGLLVSKTLKSAQHDPRTLLHPDYVSKKQAAPKLPKDMHIWHTVCKVDDIDSAQKRIASILNQGLLSTFERERHNIEISSLDPGGDKTQNIDWGVPCHIGKTPSYTQHGSIHIKMKPTLLCRKNLFFSEKTEWSWQDYLKYNHSIGHSKFWQACPPTATQNHLNNIEEKYGTYNEMWAGWKINREEIDCVVVTQTDWIEPLRKAFPNLNIKRSF